MHKNIHLNRNALLQIRSPMHNFVNTVLQVSVLPRPFVNSPTNGTDTNCTIVAATNPYPTVIHNTYRNVRRARSCLPAPIFCDASADIVDNIEDGTKNRIPMIFSTIPTAAASFNPRWLANIVIAINDIWINPSCSATGTPTFNMFFIVCLFGRRSDFLNLIPVPFFIDHGK